MPPTPAPPTPAPPNDAPTIEVLEINGVKFLSTVGAFHDGADEGAEVPIKLRARDGDGNLDYLQLTTEGGQVLDQGDCEFSMREDCILELTITAPQEYSSTIRFYGVAVDERGERSTLLEFSVTTLVQPVSFTAGEEALLEHSSGARIEIPAEASIRLTEGDPATVTIKEVLQPGASLLKVERVFDFSVVDSSGDKVVFEQPVAVTLPYELPAGKNLVDLVVLHWDESAGQWGDLPIEVIDEESQTVTVRTTRLSPFGATSYRKVSEYIIETADRLFAGSLESQYDAGLKHLVSLRGEQGIPLHLFGIPAEVGVGKASIVLDVDDLMKTTAEGKEGYVTFWVNVGAELASADIGFGLPVGIWYSLYIMDHATNRHDPTFDGSFSLATLTLPPGRLDVLNVNENGNIHPLGLQRETCVTCRANFEISIVDISANAIRGELSTKAFAELVDNMLKPENLPETALASISPGLLATRLTFDLIQSFSDQEEVVAPFTYFDDPGPETVAAYDETLFNRIIGASGGLDRSGDGRGGHGLPLTGFRRWRGVRYPPAIDCSTRPP